MDFEEGLLYRSASGEAYRLAEARLYDFGSGRDHAARDRDITAEVLRRLKITGEVPELVREGIEDALEGRQPRW